VCCEDVVKTCHKQGIYATTYYEWKKKYNEDGESSLLPGVMPNTKEKTSKVTFITWI
jgi:transposase-like protein